MKKIRFATVGIGRMGRGHIEEIMEFKDRYELGALCDNAPDRMEGLPAEWGTAFRRYTDIAELLKDDSIELVTLATRHLDHVPMAIQVLEAGKYCVVEKPVAANVREMTRLQACADAHPGHLFIRHNRRFEPAFVKARELIAAGVIGAVQYIKLYRSVGFCRRNDWMTMPEFFGGLLSNWGPHLIDQALRFLDSPVVDLWADVRNVVSIGVGDDLYKIILKAENGRVADIEVTGANTMPGRQMEIIGNRGTIVYEGGKSIHVRTIDPFLKLADLKPHPENPPLEYGNFDEKLAFMDADYDLAFTRTSDVWKHVAAAMRENVPYPIRFAEAMEVVRVTEEAIRKSGFAPLQQFLS